MLFNFLLNNTYNKLLYYKYIFFKIKTALLNLNNADIGIFSSFIKEEAFIKIKTLFDYS